MRSSGQTQKYAEKVKMNGLPDDNTHVKIEVYYDLGGRNVFSGVQEKRGYWFSATLTEEREGSWRTKIALGKGGLGGRIFLKEVTRFNAGNLETLASAILSHAHGLALLVVANDNADLHRRVSECVALAGDPLREALVKKFGVGSADEVAEGRR